MKQFLIVSSCTTRGDSGGLTGQFVRYLNLVREESFEISIFDIGFFNYTRCVEAYDIKNYYVLPERRINKLIRIIPKIRGRYAEKLILKTFDDLLSKHHFDLIIVYEIPSFADSLVTVSHKHGTRIMFYPWGSDILRRSNSIKKRIQKAFDEVDYVAGNPNSNCTLAVLKDYCVPESKLRLKKLALKGVKKIEELSGKYSRVEMFQMLGIPFSDFLIVCGYNGYKAQRHKLIINSIFKNKAVLPSNYILVFPITYGCQEDYYYELKELCESYGLNACFIRDYLTDAQMALLHLVTDLFIEIQPTDCGNAFLIEALYAKNQIITGRWLDYKQFECFGTPYHLIDKPENLCDMMSRIFTKKEQPKVISEQLRDTYKYPKSSDFAAFWPSIVEEL